MRRWSQRWLHRLQERLGSLMENCALIQQRTFNSLKKTGKEGFLGCRAE
jgi:hypothetical protein